METQGTRTRLARLIGISLIAAFGGFLFGFDMTVVSGAIPFLKDAFLLGSTSLGWAASSCVFGCIFGAALAGKLADAFGRKKVLIVTALLFAASSVGAGWAESFAVFTVWRLNAGLAVGAASSVAPIFIAETVPTRYRGGLVSFYQLAICLGLLGSYCSNYLLLATGDNAWRWMFTVGIVPSVGFFFFLFFVPESPRWLVKSGNSIKAFQVLKSVGGEEHAQSELVLIQQTLKDRKSSLRDLLKPGVLRIVVIGALLGVFSQISGANAVFLYAPEIFARASGGLKSSLFESMLIGVILLIFTFIPILFVEKVGRRPILIIGVGMMAAMLAFLTVLFAFARDQWLLILIAILCYIAAYASSIACVTWVILSEIFPNRVRGEAMSVANFCLWSANFMLLQTFPMIVQKLSLSAPFAIYAVICVVIVLFAWRIIPETKGKSLEEIEQLLSPETNTTKERTTRS